MEKWYKCSYFDKSAWILENYRNLNLSSEEGILVLLINHANENHQKLTTDCLVKLSAMTQQNVDKAISLLCAKQYLIIRAGSDGLHFDLSGLFEAETAKSERAVNQSLYDLFESEFARPLNQKELSLLSEWTRLYDNKLIMYALKEASLYKKISIYYIASILEEWNKKGYTAQMIEKGKHVE